VLWGEKDIKIYKDKHEWKICTIEQWRGGENKCGQRKGKIFFYINEVIFTVKKYEILQLHFVTFVMFAILYASVTIVTTTACIKAINEFFLSSVF
jgi:hypothetical protein